MLKKYLGVREFIKVPRYYKNSFSIMMRTLFHVCFMFQIPNSKSWVNSYRGIGLTLLLLYDVRRDSRNLSSRGFIVGSKQNVLLVLYGKKPSNLYTPSFFHKEVSMLRKKETYLFDKKVNTK